MSYEARAEQEGAFQMPDSLNLVSAILDLPTQVFKRCDGLQKFVSAILNTDPREGHEKFRNFLNCQIFMCKTMGLILPKENDPN